MLHFELCGEHKGSVNSGLSTNVIRNGTFFNNVGAVPSIGYSREFGDPGSRHERRKQELPERERMAKVDALRRRG
ncbi:MAG: hypothetical protein R3A51_10335 [Nannocystaceae bacterium]